MGDTGALLYGVHGLRSVKRLAWFSAPVWLLLAWQVTPLATGHKTLFLRDIFETHLPMKQAQAEAMRSGYLPLVDLYRAGGQPLLGNPNAVPLYPDNVLFLIAPVLWAVNAHFWLHWFAALLAMAWLARAFGLARESALAAGAVYALGGYFVSQLNLYNTVAVVALAPALIAAALRLADRGRRRYGVACGALWGLLCLGGEPFLAALAGVAALATFVSARPPRRAFWILILGSLFGTLVATPQIVETLRILPLSFRGHAGLDARSLASGSLDPRQFAEWLLPFLFGRPDRWAGSSAFWGHQYYTGHPALLFTLYPGLLALTLALAAARARGRATIWAVLACLAGLLLALGTFHPLTSWLLQHGGGLFRYPSKMFLPAAIGLALLAGIGFEGVFLLRDAPARRLAHTTLVSLSALFLAVWVALTWQPDWVSRLLRDFLPDAFPPAAVAAERARWAVLCLLSVMVLATGAIVVRAAAQRPYAAGSAFLAVHAATQLFLLAPAFPTDSVAAYRAPTLLAAIPAASRTVHGSWGSLFGESRITDGAFPSQHHFWLQRRALAELYPFFAAIWQRRFELNPSPDKLDAFLTRMAQTAVQQNQDGDRLRLLKAWGVSRLILDRELGQAHAAQVRLLLREEHFGRPVFVHEILDAAPEVSVAGSLHHAPDLLAAFTFLTRDDFDPRAAAVIPGTGPSVRGGPGEVLSLAVATESLETVVRAGTDSVVVWQRSHLPIYLATVDGKPAPVLFANLYRMGVPVPAGEHVVRIWADRRPLRRALMVAAVGVLGLVALAVAWPGTGRAVPAP
jgi:hypothetical protein